MKNPGGALRGNAREIAQTDPAAPGGCLKRNMP